MINHFQFKPIITVFFALLLLVSCKTETPKDKIIFDSIELNELKNVSYEFEINQNCSDLFGSLFDVVYFFDKNHNVSYFYQLISKDCNQLQIVKFETLHSEPFLNPIDTFSVGNLNPSGITSFFVLELDKFCLLRNHDNTIERAIFLRDNQLSNEQMVFTTSPKQDFAISFFPAFHQILSEKFTSTILPVQANYRGGDLISMFEFPKYYQFKNSKMKNELWGNTISSKKMNSSLYSLLTYHYSIYDSMYVYHLSPDGQTIERYGNNAMEIFPINTPFFDSFLSEHSSTYMKILEQECDYWTGFFYNPYTETFLLFQHNGNKLKNNELKLADSETEYLLYILDKELKIQKVKELTHNDYVFAANAGMAMPTKHGYTSVKSVTQNPGQNSLKLILSEIKIVDEKP